jgi:hypothetical protein
MEPRKSIRFIRTSPFAEEAFSEFEKRLRKTRYSERSGLGFLADKLTSDQIEATYVERKLRKTKITGPLGNVQRLEWFEFTTYKFLFERQRCTVEIDSSARTLAPLIQQFGTLAGWTASFEPLTLEPVRFLMFLKTEGVKFDVNRLKVDDVTLSVNTSAFIEVIGQKSVLNDLEKLLGQRKRTITSLSVTIVGLSKSFRIDMTSAGRIVAEGAAYEEALALCRRAVDWSQTRP